MVDSASLLSLSVDRVIKMLPTQDLVILARRIYNPNYDPKAMVKVITTINDETITEITGKPFLYWLWKALPHYVNIYFVDVPQAIGIEEVQYIHGILYIRSANLFVTEAVESIPWHKISQDILDKIDPIVKAYIFTLEANIDDYVILPRQEPINYAISSVKPVLYGDGLFTTRLRKWKRRLHSICIPHSPLIDTNRWDD